MSRDPTPAWLAEFQQTFAAAVCTPLSAAGGMLHAEPARYPSTLSARIASDARGSAHERLAIYNHQYWFRLLRVLQNELPLTSRLFGLFTFNQHAMRFLEALPPRGFDLGAACEGFDQFLAATLPESVPCLELQTQLPRAALLQAARLDLACRSVFLAPPQRPLTLTGREDLRRLRLRTSRAHQRIREHWPLVRTRAPLLSPDAPHCIALPPPLAATQTWALFRTPAGVGQVMLEPDHARLLELLETQAVAAAIDQLEAETPAAARDRLPARIERWLAQSAKLGFFAASGAA